MNYKLQFKGFFILASIAALSFFTPRAILAETDSQIIVKEPAEDEELQLKKLGMEKALTLSLLEIEGLKKRLDAQYNSEAELALLQEIFSEKLAQYAAHLSSLKQVLENLDLPGIRKIAKEFSAWREEVYNPEVKKMVELILVQQNKILLKTADLRFAKTAFDLKKKKTARLEPELWQPLLNASAFNLKMAREFTKEAGAILISYLPTPTPNASPEPTPTPSLSARKIEKIENKEIKDLVSSSLTKLKTAYANFIELNNLIKNASQN